MATTEDLLTEIKKMIELFYNRELAYREQLTPEKQDKTYIPSKPNEDWKTAKIEK